MISQNPPISKDELQTVQANMLTSGKVEGMLPLYVEEIDFQIRLFYNFTGKKLLSQQMKLVDLHMKQSMQLMYEAVNHLLNCSTYFLQAEHVVLHPDFLFTDSALTRIYGLYVPLRSWEAAGSIHHSLKELFMYMLPYIKDADGKTIQELMRCFQEEWAIRDIHTYLEGKRSTAGSESSHSAIQGHMDDRGLSQEQGQNPNVNSSQASFIPQSQNAVEPDQAVPNLSVGKEESEFPLPEWSWRREADDSWMETSTNLLKIEKETGQSKRKTENHKNQERSSDTSQFKRLILIALIALIAAWMPLSFKPSEGMVYICIGLSLAVAAVSYLYFIKSGYKQEDAGNTGESKHAEEDLMSWNHSFLWEDETPISNTDLSVEEERIAVAAEELPLANQEPDRTAFLSNESDRTVLLSEAKAEEPAIWLQTEKEGEIQKFPILHFPFTIGRDAARVDYCETTLGVSKQHFEIIQEGGAIAIRDLGSSNGTFLNEEPLIPYKTYPVQGGDRIVMCSKRFIVHG
ncbi:DUF6382 domain-containing protein [Marinicrinis lubricantis]